MNKLQLGKSFHSQIFTRTFVRMSTDETQHSAHPRFSHKKQLYVTRETQRNIFYDDISENLIGTSECVFGREAVYSMCCYELP